jgi:hypothetical protein
MRILQEKYKLSPLLAASIHLNLIIFLMYLSYIFHILYMEQFYSPHLIFSSFIFSLQTNMISNFKTLFNI